MFYKALLIFSVLFASDEAALAEEKNMDLRELLINVSNMLREVKATNSKVFTTLKEVKETHSMVFTTLQEAKTTQSMVSTALNNFTEKCEYTSSKPAEPTPAKDCAELWKSGERTSGVYRISPVTWNLTESFEVYCDMNTDGGGWTVFQRRGQYGNEEDYFDRNWNEYRDGFGDLQKEFWLGNEKIYGLARQNNYELRIDMWDTDGKRARAKYSSFNIEAESQNYHLSIEGYTGNAGDSMSKNNEMMFTTKDRDNDKHSTDNCAVYRRGAWWYNTCTFANLNGLNLKGKKSDKGIYWYYWKNRFYSLAATEMKIRPKTF